tara:strand:+ start:451 stop:825 length:375 start_codon:yes stop_codon:yes gene_type:complete
MSEINKVKNIRPFLGSKDFNASRRFYKLLGFKEFILNDKLSLFKINENVQFHLQDYYVKELVENSMIMIEIEDISFWSIKLQSKFSGSEFEMAKLSNISEENWGKVLYLHDPSGNLWHFCQLED